MQANRFSGWRKVLHDTSSERVGTGGGGGTIEGILVANTNGLSASEFARPGGDRFVIANNEIVLGQSQTDDIANER